MIVFLVILGFIFLHFIILFNEVNIFLVETTYFIFITEYTRSKCTNAKGNILSQVFRAYYIYIRV